jgi:hypothetical protein
MLAFVELHWSIKIVLSLLAQLRSRVAVLLHPVRDVHMPCESCFMGSVVALEKHKAMPLDYRFRPHVKGLGVHQIISHASHREA